jgi:hypothetical protein
VVQGDLSTTNLLLGIMAAVSLFEALVILLVGAAAFMAYSRIKELVRDIERRQIAPLMTRVDAILENVEQVTTTLRVETEQVDHALRSTVNSVDDAARHVRSSVRENASRIAGFLHAVRVGLDEILRAIHVT